MFLNSKVLQGSGVGVRVYMELRKPTLSGLLVMICVHLVLEKGWFFRMSYTFGSRGFRVVLNFNYRVWKLCLNMNFMRFSFGGTVRACGEG